MASPRAAKAVEFTFNRFRYAAQHWGEESQPPVLAIHGWLDNSASFDVLAQYLTRLQILAPDMAGHGLSDHRTGLSDYPIWSETAEMFAMADAMGWQQFALMGHSRGAMMSLLAAAAFPERVTHLILIDALGPPPVAPATAQQRMVNSLGELQRRLQRPTSCYPTYDDAINARCQSRFSPVTRASAELLAERGLTELEAGFNWHADGKLWAPSNVALSAEQIEAFVAKISAKVLVLLGEQGMKTNVIAGSPFERAMSMMVEELNTNVQEFDDGHFLHMERAAVDVANAIQTFFDND